MFTLKDISRRKWRIVAAFAALAAAALGAKKTFDYAAPPNGDKPCDYVFPEAQGASASAKEPGSLALPAGTPSFVRLGGMTVDASCLNKSAVFGVARITTEEDVRQTLAFAREAGLHVTSAGMQHSMGGQSFFKGGIVMDMKGMAGMTLHKERRVLRVQSGATWAAVQQLLDKEGLSVKAMQSINIFTVGGTLSVNAHGLAHDPGQVAPTVRSLRVMLADGSTVTASRTENAELFRHVLGGYGLFGVILEAELDVVPNEVYAWSRHQMAYGDFPQFFKDRVDGDPEVGLAYGRLAMNDGDYLAATTAHLFTKTPWEQPIPALKPAEHEWFPRLVINFSKTGSLGRWTRNALERHVAPRVAPCVSRNAAMGDDYVCDVSRNRQMFDSMGYLKNRLPDTDILQEYFIPHDRMTAFVDGLRTVVREHDANLLNVTIRIVRKDETTALPYAKDDRFAFVLYFNQRMNDKAAASLQATTTALVDLALANGGAFYLPYRLDYSAEQLRRAYPEADAFFAAKRRFDPGELFLNEWYVKYGR